MVKSPTLPPRPPAATIQTSVNFRNFAKRVFARLRRSTFTNFKALFPVLSTDFPYLVQVKIWKNRGRVYWSKIITKERSKSRKNKFRLELITPQSSSYYGSPVIKKGQQINTIHLHQVLLFWNPSSWKSYLLSWQQEEKIIIYILTLASHNGFKENKEELMQDSTRLFLIFQVSSLYCL